MSEGSDYSKICLDNSSPTNRKANRILLNKLRNALKDGVSYALTDRFHLEKPDERDSKRLFLWMMTTMPTAKPEPSEETSGGLLQAAVGVMACKLDNATSSVKSTLKGAFDRIWDAGIDLTNSFTLASFGGSETDVPEPVYIPSFRDRMALQIT